MVILHDVRRVLLEQELAGVSLGFSEYRVHIGHGSSAAYDMMANGKDAELVGEASTIAPVR